MKVGCDQHADLISKMENSTNAMLLWSTYFDASSRYAQLHTQLTQLNANKNHATCYYEFGASDEPNTPYAYDTSVPPDSPV